MTSNLAGKRVLLVEDEILIGLEIALVLEEAGAAVIGPVATVPEALKAIAVNRLDAAVLDVRLGAQEVFPAAEALAKLDVPFIFHTGHADGAMLAAWPGRLILRKPVAPEAIVAGLVDLLHP